MYRILHMKYMQDKTNETDIIHVQLLLGFETTKSAIF
jgi:hypothetical protein